MATSTKLQQRSSDTADVIIVLATMLIYGNKAASAWICCKVWQCAGYCVQHLLLCRNLAAELGLSCIQAFKLDATTALQQQSTPQADMAHLDNTVSDMSQDATTALKQLGTTVQAAVAHVGETVSDTSHSEFNQKDKSRRERKAKVQNSSPYTVSGCLQWRIAWLCC